MGKSGSRSRAFVTRADVECTRSNRPSRCDIIAGATAGCLILTAVLIIAIILAYKCIIDARYDDDKYLPVYSFEPLPISVTTSSDSPSGPGRHHPYHVLLNATVRIRNPIPRYRCVFERAIGPITYADGHDVVGVIDVGPVDMGPSSSEEVVATGRLYAYEPLDVSPQHSLGASVRPGGDGEEFGVRFNVSLGININRLADAGFCLAVDCRVRLNKLALEGSRVISSSCDSRRLPYS